MTIDRRFKQAVRTRMAATGESYTRSLFVLRRERAQARADRWNDAHPPGTVARMQRFQNGPSSEVVTRGFAFVSSDNMARVHIESEDDPRAVELAWLTPIGVS